MKTFGLVAKLVFVAVHYPLMRLMKKVGSEERQRMSYCRRDV